MLTAYKLSLIAFALLMSCGELQEDSDIKDGAIINQTDQILLDKYLNSVLEVKALRFDSGKQDFMDKRIGFDLKL